jgi:tripartite-type tricarboxylate transporter receptor subunit TctC
MGASDGWTWVVENKPGAAGNVGTALAARSPADGYTLLLGQTAALAINPSLYETLRYDPVKDFSPVGIVAIAPLIVATASGSEYTTFKQVLEVAERNHDSVKLGFSGIGTVAHLSAALLEKSTGAQFLKVPYKGASPALVDVIGGRIDLYISSFPSLLNDVQSGRLRALAITAATRAADLPNVPTIAELGFPDFEAVSWFGLLAPAGTPDSIVEQLNVALNDALADPAVIERFKADGAAIHRGSRQEFAELIKNDIARWRIAVRASNATVQ